MGVLACREEPDIAIEYIPEERPQKKPQRKRKAKRARISGHIAIADESELHEDAEERDDSRNDTDDEGSDNDSSASAGLYPSGLGGEVLDDGQFERDLSE